MGLRGLSKVQWGAEATAGSAVAATAKAMGVYSAAWRDVRTIEQPREIRANMAEFYRAITLGVQAEVQIDATASFEELPYFLNMAIKGSDGSADAAGTVAYTFTHSPSPLTAASVPKTYTIEVGDNTQVFELEYGFARELEISFATRELSRVRANVVGRQLTAGTFTPALNDRTIEDAVGQKWAMYLDDSGGTIGTTALTGSLVGGRWRMNMHVPHHYIDGNLYFTSSQMIQVAPTLECTFEFNSSINTLMDKWRNNTRQLVRLRNTGSQIMGGGTPTYKRITLDGAYQVIDVQAIGGAERDGVQTVVMQFRGEYDATWGSLFSAEVVNKVGTALP